MSPVWARWLGVHLPLFRLERCGYTAEDSVVLVEEQRGAWRLIALTPAAAEVGVRLGMSATEALAIEPELVVERLDPEGEAEDRRALVDTFRRLSDGVAEIGPADLVLEAGRVAALYGGEAGLIEAAARLAGALGHSVQLAIADDWRAALAVARCAEQPEVVPPGEGAAALARLPLGALEPPTALAEALAAVGVRRVGELAALEPAAVVGRFGAEAGRLHRVARGGVGDPRLGFAPEQEALARHVVLGEPTERFEPIRFVLPGVLRELAEGLRQRDRLATRLLVRLVLEAGPARLVRLRLGRPTRDPEAWLAALEGRLGEVQVRAPIAELVIEIEEDSAEVGLQPGLSSRAVGAEPVRELVGRLADTLGEAALVRPALLESWQPEAAWSARFALDPRPPPRPWEPPRPDPEAPHSAWERSLEPPRPALLAERPSPAAVRVGPAGGPVQVMQAGAWEPVRRAEGPERLSGGWWREEGGWERDYWVVELGSGVIGWLYSVPAEGGAPARWWWHGWWD